MDHDPEIFMQLINYLRRLDQESGMTNVYIPVPVACSRFGGLIEYYDMALAIYPQEWRTKGRSGGWSVTNGSDGHVILCSTNKNGHSCFFLDLDPERIRKPAMCSGVTVGFKAGAQGAIRWAAPNRCSNDSYCSQRSKIETVVATSDEDHIIRMQCSYNVTMSAYCYTLQVNNEAPVSWNNLRRELGPSITLSGTAWVSEVSYLFN